MKRILLASLFLVTSTASVAGTKLTQFLPATTFQVGSQVRVADPIRNRYYDQTNYSAQVALVYGRENKSDTPNTVWTADLTYKLTFYDENYTQKGPAVTGNSLQISFSSSNPIYLSSKLFNDASANFPNVLLELTAVTLTGPVPSDVRLELSLVNNYGYNLAPLSPAITYRPSDNSLYWPYMKGAEEYQVEWVYVDNQDAHASFATSANAFAYKEPVRINVGNQYYDQFNFTYPEGLVYLRVRGVGKFLNNAINTSERYTPWFYTSSPFTITKSTTDTLRNWQYQTRYSEGGKFQKKMEFLDGTLKVRQELGNVSSDGTVMASQSLYDFEGRATVGVMPTPLSGLSMAFKPKLNTFTNGRQEYDKELALTSMTPLAPTSASALYYSPANTVETVPFKDFIPSSNGYTFSQIQFAEEVTSKPVMKSIVGQPFRLQDPTLGAKNTRYKYTNADDTELRRLFGSNVGDASHYKKNYEIDENGQVSLNYLDQEGRTIATGLAGNSPTNLSPLSSNVKNTVQVSLDGNNVMDYTTHTSRSVTVKYNLTPGTKYHFRYSMKGVINQAGNYINTCKSCTYNLKITVTDPDGYVVPTTPIKVDSISPATYTCTDLSFTKNNLVDSTLTFAKEGEYTITKELTLNTGAIDILLRSLATLPNYPNLSSYQTTALSAVDYSSCDVTCQQSCLSEVYRLNPTWKNNPSILQSQIDAAVNTCMTTNCSNYVDSVFAKISANECTSIYNQILQQVSPEGPFNTTTWLTSKFSSVSNWGTTPVPTGVADLMDNSKFLPEWAKALAPFHPEYCHYTNCTRYTDSRIFDADMGVVSDWTTAQSKGYLNPTPVTVDPFFNASRIATLPTDPATSAARTAMLSLLANYKTEGQLDVDINKNNSKSDPVSLEQFVNSYFPYGTIVTYVPKLDEKWNLYKSLYEGAKVGITSNLFAGAYGASTYYTACAYQTGPDVIVLNPAMPTDRTVIESQNAQTLVSLCTSGCPENVKVWMSLLKNTCAPLTVSDSVSITNRLSAYCTRKCGSSNPFGIILQGDVATDPDLSAANAILALPSYGCNLNAVAMVDPYTYNNLNGVKVEAWTLSPGICAHNFKNNNIQIPTTPPNATGVIPNMDIAANTNNLLTLGTSQNFIARFTAKLVVPLDGVYEFIVSADNRAKITIDGVSILNETFDTLSLCGGSTSDRHLSVTLSPGVKDIEVVLVQAMFTYSLILKWKTPGQTAFVTIPPASFSPPSYVTGMLSCPATYSSQNDCPYGPSSYTTPCSEAIVAALDKLIKAKQTTSSVSTCPSNWQLGTVYNVNSVTQLGVPITAYCNSGEQSSLFISDVLPTSLYPSAADQQNSFLIFTGATPTVYTSLGYCSPPSSLLNTVSSGNQLVSFYVKNNGTNLFIPKSQIVSFGLPTVDCNELSTNGASYNPSSSFALTIPIVVKNFNGVAGVSTVSAYLFNSNPNGNYGVSANTIKWKVPGIQQNMLCNATYAIDLNRLSTDCHYRLDQIALAQAQRNWQEAVDRFTSNFLNEYYSKCIQNPLDEDLTVEYEINEYHYTLYYYDQAGGLIQTVPPAGVNPLTTAAFNNGVWIPGNEPDHHLVTRYKCNSIDQLLSNNSPDGSLINYWYDSKGYLKLTQNMKQYYTSTSTANQYSYLRYDDQGRMTEQGQLQNFEKPSSYLSNIGNKKDVLALLDNTSFPSPANYDLQQINKTNFDFSTDPTQLNLRGRVASMESKSSPSTTLVTTSFSYDAHGMIKCLTQNIAGFGAKKMEYEYDLISGNINKTIYQRGATDQFIHFYEYDLDNRLKGVFTSADNVNWEEEARQFYYKHGPLARIELGEDKVQGMDYYYTLQGWMKGVNIPAGRTLSSGKYKVAQDIGNDGYTTSKNTLNKYVAQDEFAFGLGYFNGDYTPSGAGINLGAVGAANWNTTDLNANVLSEGLYSGNISWMTTQIHQMGYNTLGFDTRTAVQNETYGLRSYAYQYDQLNRLTKAFNYDTYAAGWKRTAAINTLAYDASYSYDANGNLGTAKVNGPTPSLMDDLYYSYIPNYPSNGFNSSNKLISVTDLAGNQGYGDVSTGTPSNYAYDEVGNLIAETSEDMIVTWTVDRKVASISHANPYRSKVYFTYDGQGNRVKKSEVTTSYFGVVTTVNTHYIRDAAGSVIATYYSDGTYNQTEINLYGSKRLGTWMTPTTTNGVFRRIPSSKQYELSNHLGNVLATIPAFKTGVDINADKKVDYYTTLPISGNDYYAFGMAMPSRTFGSNAYHYGFNGKPLDKEWNSGGAQYDYGFRIYDPRLGKFLSVDPLTVSYPDLSPYQFAANSPVRNIDIDGMESGTSNTCGTKQPVASEEEAITKQVEFVYVLKNVFEGDLGDVEENAPVFQSLFDQIFPPADEITRKLYAASAEVDKAITGSITEMSYGIIMWGDGSKQSVIGDYTSKNIIAHIPEGVMKGFEILLNQMKLDPNAKGEEALEQVGDVVDDIEDEVTTTPSKTPTPGPVQKPKATTTAAATQPVAKTTRAARVYTWTGCDGMPCVDDSYWKMEVDGKTVKTFYGDSHPTPEIWNKELLKAYQIYGK